jgi:hypothetical protein
MVTVHASLPAQTDILAGFVKAAIESADTDWILSAVGESLGEEWYRLPLTDGQMTAARDLKKFVDALVAMLFFFTFLILNSV